MPPNSASAPDNSRVSAKNSERPRLVFYSIGTEAAGRQTTIRSSARAQHVHVLAASLDPRLKAEYAGFP